MGINRWPLVLSLLVWSLCSEYSEARSSQVISVMTYNLENLFDTLHDKGKEDWTYLPLAVKKSSQVVQDYCRSLSKPLLSTQLHRARLEQRSLGQKN